MTKVEALKKLLTLSEPDCLGPTHYGLLGEFPKSKCVYCKAKTAIIEYEALAAKEPAPVKAEVVKVNETIKTLPANVWWHSYVPTDNLNEPYHGLPSSGITLENLYNGIQNNPRFSANGFRLNDINVFDRTFGINFVLPNGGGITYYLDGGPYHSVEEALNAVFSYLISTQVSHNRMFTNFDL